MRITRHEVPIKIYLNFDCKFPLFTIQTHSASFVSDIIYSCTKWGLMCLASVLVNDYPNIFPPYRLLTESRSFWKFSCLYLGLGVWPCPPLYRSNAVILCFITVPQSEPVLPVCYSVLYCYVLMYSYCKIRASLQHESVCRYELFPPRT